MYFLHFPSNLQCRKLSSPDWLYIVILCVMIMCSLCMNITWLDTQLISVLSPSARKSTGNGTDVLSSLSFLKKASARICSIGVDFALPNLSASVTKILTVSPAEVFVGLSIVVESRSTSSAITYIANWLSVYGRVSDALLCLVCLTKLKCKLSSLQSNTIVDDAAILFGRWILQCIHSNSASM